MPITSRFSIHAVFVLLYSRYVRPGWVEILVELVFGVVELLERVLGEAFVFIGVGQRDGGHALMPVSTVDQFVEFGQSVFEVIETAHALHRLLPLFDGNFEAWIDRCSLQGYPCAVV